jgi:monothiol glutaredoxin
MNNPVAERIQQDVSENDVVLFMKGTPVFPQCGFSAAVVQVLSHLGVRFKGVNVLEDPGLRQGIKDFSSWPTIPQLYVKGEFIGGCDIIREMFQSGELQKMFEDKGIEMQNAA